MAEIKDFPNTKKEMFEWDKPFIKVCEEMAQFVKKKKGALTLDFIKNDMLYTIIVRSAIDYPTEFKKKK